MTTIINFVIALVVVLAVVQVANAQLTSFVAAKQLDALAAAATSVLSSPKSLEEAFHAQKFLKALKRKIQCDCKQISSIFESSSDGLSLYYGLGAAAGCGCSKIALSDTQKSSLTAASSDENLASFAGALLALKSTNSEAALQLKNYIAPSGKFKSSVHDDVATATTTNAKIALLLLEQLAEASGSVKEQVSDLTESALNLLPAGDDDSETDPTLLASLMKISDKKPRLSSSRLLVITESLLDLVASGDLVTASQAYAALEAVYSYKIAPVFISIDQPRLEKPSLTVSLKDALGRAVTADSTNVRSIKSTSSSSKELVASGTPLSVVKGSADLSALSLPAGRYSADIVVNVPGRTNAVASTRFFTVPASVKVTDVFAGVTDSKQSSTDDLLSLSAERALTKAQVSASALDTNVFHVAFTLNAQSVLSQHNNEDASSDSAATAAALFKPHQVFVRLIHTASGTSTYLAAKALRSQSADSKKSSSSGSSKVSYRTVLIPSEEVETFLHLSGEYTVLIVVGDPAMAAPVEWTVGSLTLKFPAKPPTDQHPLYTKPLLDAADEALKPLPEIVHQMRAPDKRASWFMSLSFTVAVVAPLVALAIYLASLRPNFKLFSGLSSALFVGALAAVLVVYVAYWFQLPGFGFYQTLNYLCLLSPITLVVARSALQGVTDARKAATAVPVGDNKSKKA